MSAAAVRGEREGRESYVLVETYDGNRWRFASCVGLDGLRRGEVECGSGGSLAVVETALGTEVKVRFPKGGSVTVHPNLVSAAQCSAVAEELFESGRFKRYSVQGVLEPRVQFLVHREATSGPGDQPSYGYAGTSLKAVPGGAYEKLGELVEDLSGKFVNETKGEGFNIGAHVVYYRDGNDGMGYHADKSRNEQLVLTAVLESRGWNRELTIKPTKRATVGDIRVKVCVGAGGVYWMDGELQKCYVHGIAKDPRVSGKGKGRLVVVLRHGDAKRSSRDSGVAAGLLPSRRKEHRFGRPESTLEGEIRTKFDLWESGEHRNFQKSVSGNRVVGCDAITMSVFLMERCVAWNDLTYFLKPVYEVDGRSGGYAMLKSLAEERAVRVYRSSKSDGPWQATSRGRRVARKRQVYRYDGLYYITKAEPGNRHDFRFRLARASKGNDPTSTNRLSAEEHVSHCYKVGTMARFRRNAKYEGNESGVGVALVGGRSSGEGREAAMSVAGRAVPAVDEAERKEPMLSAAVASAAKGMGSYVLEHVELYIGSPESGDVGDR